VSDDALVDYLGGDTPEAQRLHRELMAANAEADEAFAPVRAALAARDRAAYAAAVEVWSPLAAKASTLHAEWAAVRGDVLTG
jgi:hypothetical protein